MHSVKQSVQYHALHKENLQFINYYNQLNPYNTQGCFAAQIETGVNINEK